jgi:hypothetical protein
MGAPEMPAAMCTPAAAMISANHMHSLMIPAADVAAGAEKMYSIKGLSPHDHMVTVTAPMFTMLKARVTIMMTSTNVSGHTHVCTVMCA